MPGRRNTLRQWIEKRIAKHDDAIFLTREFRDFADERQVLRALHALTVEGKLIRLGYGVYARAEVSPLTGQPRLATRGGFNGAVGEALNKLGVAWEPTGREQPYNEVHLTQVAVNPAVRVKSRFARRLRYQDTELRLER